MSRDPQVQEDLRHGDATASGEPTAELEESWRRFQNPEPGHHTESTHRMPLGREVGLLLHKGVNETGNVIPSQETLTDSWYQRYSGPRMYEAMDFSRVKRQARGMLQQAPDKIRERFPVKDEEDSEKPPADDSPGEVVWAPQSYWPGANAPVGDSQPVPFRFGERAEPFKLGAPSSPVPFRFGPPARPFQLGDVAAPPVAPEPFAAPATQPVPARPSSRVGTRPTPAELGRRGGRATASRPRGDLSRSERQNPGAATRQALLRGFGNIPIDDDTKGVWER